ncbi:MAG: asparagine synthetase B, partial [Rhodospirillaceae bacterium]|nr:asparagine synthetase B [Rhodospirillaceae bacterium]
MCGIAGVMMRGGQPPSRDTLQALALALRHRGPDGQAVHVHGATGLVHARLAIVDLLGGAQPLISADGVALIANAEIYNDLDLRREMHDVSFATGSDCESPLHLYRKVGDVFAERLRGMYAIAISDSAQRRLILARDPFGIKPLYYAETPDGVCFASEPQALIAAGLVVPRVNA